MLLDATPLEAMDEQQQQSPVDVVTKIREELAEFQHISSKQALREAMREACKEALLRTVSHTGFHPVVDHLKQRRLIRSGPRRTRMAAETASHSSRRLTVSHK
jgi:hypothetical protein